MEKCYVITYWTFNRLARKMVSGICRVFKNKEDAIKYVANLLDLEVNTVEAGFKSGAGTYSNSDVTFLIEEHVLE